MLPPNIVCSLLVPPYNVSVIVNYTKLYHLSFVVSRQKVVAPIDVTHRRNIEAAVHLKISLTNSKLEIVLCERRNVIDNESGKGMIATEEEIVDTIIRIDRIKIEINIGKQMNLFTML